MQYTPSPGSLAGYGTGGGGGGLAPPSGGGYGSLAGFGGGGLAPPSMNGGMGMGMGGSMRDGGAGVSGGYDDAGSVAGSAMTFMDGASRGGLTSQYGLPKYPHQAKPDPRRLVLSHFPRLPLRRLSAARVDELTFVGLWFKGAKRMFIWISGLYSVSSVTVSMSRKRWNWILDLSP